MGGEVGLVVMAFCSPREVVRWVVMLCVLRRWKGEEIGT